MKGSAAISSAAARAHSQLRAVMRFDACCLPTFSHPRFAPRALHHFTAPAKYGVLRQTGAAPLGSRLGSQHLLVIEISARQGARSQHTPHFRSGSKQGSGWQHAWTITASVGVTAGVLVSLREDAACEAEAVGSNAVQAAAAVGKDSSGAAAEEARGVLGSLAQMWGAVCRSARVWQRILRHLLVFGPLLALYLPCWAVGLEEWWWAGLLAGVEASGAAAVKFGQWAATRADVFPAPLCLRLSRLHAHACLHPLHHTLAALQPLLGEHPDWSLQVEAEALGSGCMAQVHKAALRRGPGADEEWVAVKVVHPGVLPLVLADLALLRAGAWVLEQLPGAKWLSMGEAVEEFAELLGGQLDMRCEARSLCRFHHNFRHHPHIAFPLPVPGLVSSSVLVETLMEGQLLGEWMAGAGAGAGAAGARGRVARMGVGALLQMAFDDNFLHADLHPGNILVSFPDGPDGPPRLALLDAGLTAELSARDRRNFLDLFAAIVKGDGRGAGELMVTQAREERCSDKEAFKDRIGEVVSEALGARLRLGEVHVGTLLLRAFSLAREYEVKVESAFAAVCVAIMVLEGVGRRLHPDLDVLALAAPVLLKHKAKDYWTSPLTTRPAPPADPA